MCKGTKGCCVRVRERGRWCAALAAQFDMVRGVLYNSVCREVNWGTKRVGPQSAECCSCKGCVAAAMPASV
jgi:hypothetical protein